MVCNRIVFRTGSCKDRATKFTWTTRGRRWARSRNSSWRSRCAEIASATSSRASYRSASVSQGDEECLSISVQYGLSARDGSRGGGMETDDLLCSRNARPQKDGKAGEEGANSG